MALCRSFTVESLPVELQCAIIRTLCERVLALECREEGGPPIHFSRFGTIDPDRNSPEWEANCWACTWCLRLLPFYAFNNQMLSRIGYRKPTPGSRIAERYRTLRRRYGITTTRNWGHYRRNRGGDTMQTLGATAQWELLDRLLGFQSCGMTECERTNSAEFERLSDSAEDEIFDRDAHAVENLRAGSNRRARRCIECRFQRGEFRWCAGQGKGIGTVKVPIDNKRPEVNVPVFAMYRSDALDRPWTMYKARCPGCEKWKELRAFRVGGLGPRWNPVSVETENAAVQERPYSNWDGAEITEGFLNNLQCNHCFAQVHGYKALGEELVRWLAYLVDIEVEDTGNYLVYGLEGLYNGMGIPYLPHLHHRGGNPSHDDVLLVRQQRDEWLSDARNLDQEWTRQDKGRMEWMKSYDVKEVIWYWLKACAEEIKAEGKGDVLVEWALRRNEALES
ncbi:hypothetical protein BDW75DRAFT_248147 [Aspergillus navahoensis]